MASPLCALYRRSGPPPVTFVGISEWDLKIAVFAIVNMDAGTVLVSAAYYSPYFDFDGVRRSESGRHHQDYRSS